MISKLSSLKEKVTKTSGANAESLMLQTKDKTKTLDFGVDFFEMRVRVVMEFVNDDTSGSTSSASSLNKGTKAKKLNVSCLLPMKSPRALKELIDIAQSTEPDGSRTVYIISEETADAMDVREVIFDDRLEVNKADGMRGWNIGFTVKEYQSVPEVAEQRNEFGEIIGGGIAGNEVAAEDEEEGALNTKGPFYDILKKADAYLGDLMS